MGGLFETSILQGDLKNIYTMQEILDYNVYGVTHKCKDSKTGKLVALKIINKKYLEKICGQNHLAECFQLIKKEIEILKKMDGDYSLHLIEDKETEDSFYIITDIWDSNLENFISTEKTSLKFDEIKYIFIRLNIVFKRMVENNIIHGNLKLSNILIKKIKNKMIPILSDYIKKDILDEELNIIQSTTQFSAPEILEGNNYDNKVDLWSIGVILYKLYFNEYPFNGETQVAIFNDIMSKKKLKKSDENIYFNDLIKRLLIIDPNNRITWEEYFNHKFWEIENENEDLNINENTENEDIENENIINKYIIKKDYKYIFQKNIENKNNQNSKLYNIYYCMNENINQKEQLNKNVEDLKKMQINVDKNKGSIDIVLYREITKRIQLEYLTKLILYGLNLKKIDILTNIPANNLYELDLSKNKIENIESLPEISYDNLITLNLGNNNIYDITPLIKVSFTNLKNLNLSHNLITNIESLSEFPFNDLDKLKLSSNKIRNIDILTKVPFINLTYLDLSNNKISDPSQALGFISIKNLIHLDLSHNSIKTIEGLNVAQYKNLKSLELGDNDITNIDILKDAYFNELNILSLYDNNIDNGNIFAEVPFKNLKELNLSYNKFQNIDFINNIVFKDLEKLNLSGNNISDLTILNNFDLNNLKELGLKNNKLKEKEENENILNDLKIKYKKLKIIYN